MSECRYEREVDKRIMMLNELNARMPKSKRLKLPSLITNDYVSRALDMIDEIMDKQKHYHHHHNQHHPQAVRS